MLLQGKVIAYAFGKVVAYAITFWYKVFKVIGSYMLTLF
jgi:hypothetical protein